jgi:hypothetical protein
MEISSRSVAIGCSGAVGLAVLAYSLSAGNFSHDSRSKSLDGNRFCAGKSLALRIYETLLNTQMKDKVCELHFELDSSQQLRLLSNRELEFTTRI